MWVQVPPSVPFELNMKDQKPRAKHEVFLVFIVIIIAILVGPGCTWTFHRPPMKLNTPQVPTTKTSEQYYVIDESSTVPDAYFKTKDEAENYKEYFKEHHNYKIVKLQ